MFPPPFVLSKGALQRRGHAGYPGGAGHLRAPGRRCPGRRGDLAAPRQRPTGENGGSFPEFP